MVRVRLFNALLVAGCGTSIAAYFLGSPVLGMIACVIVIRAAIQSERDDAADKLQASAEKIAATAVAAPQSVEATLAEAREVGAAVGPWQVAADFGASAGASLDEIALVYAGAVHPDFPHAAMTGMRLGFSDYLAADYARETTQ